MPTYIKNYLATLLVNTHAQLDLDLVSHMQAAHLAQYSFSSINALQDKVLSLEPKILFERLIEQREGGYCFEHNKIFHLALEALGFDVKILIGRVMLNGQTQNPRSHRLILLTLDNKQYLIDVGFGVSTPIIPLPIDKSGLHQQGVNTYQVKRTDNFIEVKQTQPELKYIYRIELGEFYESDCEIAHFYSHQHQSAAFVNNLVVSRIADSERFLIRNNQYFYWNEKNKHSTELAITSSAQLYQLITEVFKIQVPETFVEKLFKCKLAA
ncbi:hypothetical protein AMS58_20665 [Pseudoalteromonas porphyrae]|uniref:Arylamine N-acetyltransferase n=2 Tax=Pseudoalteromonas TaxID=53246 RepID=A0A0N0M1J3_9GAMM|nr:MULTISPECIES: arylamine N-acetyltransferase [Pseudoalteromonas]KPH65278.1 hypothetical protein ADS77_03145 [Pseudoalteromonas porphyrae]KPH92813.1 hypothetical protein AMS58_20665 [Pseudoalteromonas porphyrae]NMR27268.1 arylamine N-acetyltransferase [Pseudoalteromonas sp. NEC-BIFX-2020_015]NNG44011.1 arylamine N-acetyltransferase [Pseudoalteromonas sp. NEC-BIFX-2020_002]